jgi:2-dehydro-3-deoxyglucarate aldolase/4-hydroxy-2-oxoheptanedioate aldolase
MKNFEKTAGIVMNMNDPVIAELIGHLGFDYIWIDTEHGPIDYFNLELTLMGCTAGGIDSLVRVPWNDQVMVKRVLDLGPSGIIFPMIITAEDADRAMKSCLYPPEGVRGYGPTRAVRWYAYDPMEYIKTSADNIVRFIQIEHFETVKNLREIIKNPYIDGYIFGPADMSGSIGQLLHFKDKDAQDLFNEAKAILKENNKYFGVCVGSYDADDMRIWEDMPMITTGSDFMSLHIGSKIALDAILDVQGRK